MTVLKSSSKHLMPYFIKFVFTFLQLYVHMLRVRRQETARAKNLLHDLQVTLKGKFDKPTFKKVVKSHAVYAPMICDAFTRLHGRPTTDAERVRMVHYFICSSLFDNFFDDKLLNDDELYAISFLPETFLAKNFDERMFLHSHMLLKDYVKDKEAYLEMCRQVYHSQQQSKEQFRSNISDDEIERITFNKGGYSVLLSRFYLDVKPSVEEDNCWYQIGSIIQLSNDIYDIYKDLHDGIQTLPVRMKDAYLFEAFFMKQVNTMKAYIKALPCSPGTKQQFNIAMAGMYALSLVGIHRLKELQGITGHLPALNSLRKQSLIFDLEKPRGILEWMRFVYKTGRL